MFGAGKRHYMMQFWMLVSKFYQRCLLAVDISSFCLTKQVEVVKMAVTVGCCTGTRRLYLGLQFQHVVLKITNKMLNKFCSRQDVLRYGRAEKQASTSL